MHGDPENDPKWKSSTIVLRDLELKLGITSEEQRQQKRVKTKCRMLTSREQRNQTKAAVIKNFIVVKRNRLLKLIC